MRLRGAVVGAVRAGFRGVRWGVGGVVGCAQGEGGFERRVAVVGRESLGNAAVEVWEGRLEDA